MFAVGQPQAKPVSSNQMTDAQSHWLYRHRMHLLWLGLIAAVLLLMWFSVMAVFDRPIRRAEIIGKFAQVSRLQVEQLLEPYARHGYVSIDLDAVKRAVEKLSWVDYARVERAWPDSLRVVVTEQVAVARWGDSGLLNTRGELFLPEAHDVPQDLPLLVGPEGTEAQVARLYLETYSRLLAIGLRISRVTLDERGAWDLMLSNGVEVRLGRQDINARLARFITAANVVATRAGNVRYIDMRYSNGFSIGWGTPGVTAVDATHNVGNDDHV
mgnify:CR=1 FL=1